MGRFFWILVGLIGLVLILLIASGDTQTIFGLEKSAFGPAAVAALWAVLIGSGLFNREYGFVRIVRHIGLWILIILGLMAVYVFRFDLQDLGSRFTGGIIPGSPISSANDSGRQAVTLIRSDSGHFEATAGVNGSSVRFLVDTGATAIVMAYHDARNAGIDVDSLSFSIPTRTANGTGRAARATIDNFYLGGIERNNITVMVAEAGRLDRSLLGQQFLESLSSYEKRGDRLTLRD